MTKRERFSAGWTGAVAVGLFVYIALAIALILVDGARWPWLDVFNLYSDSVASICVAILTGAAARGSADPAARRTWWLLTAALGDLQHREPAAFDVLAVRDRPLPVDRRRILPGLLPAGLRCGADGDPHRRRARAMGPARPRQAILMLGFGAFFWFFVIAPTAAAQRDPNVLKYALAQATSP